MVAASSGPNRGPAATLGFLLVLLLALGVAWGLSRIQYRERPRWDDRAFRALFAAGVTAPWRERWVVAVYPDCVHCRTSLASLLAARDRRAAPVRVTALLVDVKSPPTAEAVSRLGADEVRWDRGGRWRSRWGHRVYGEVLCFEPDGRLRHTYAPFAVPEDAAIRLSRLPGEAAR